jgi:hypothetical protein
MGVALRRIELAGAAHAELVDGVVQLRPENAKVEATSASPSSDSLAARLNR